MVWLLNKTIILQSFNGEFCVRPSKSWRKKHDVDRLTALDLSLKYLQISIGESLLIGFQESSTMARSNSKKKSNTGAKGGSVPVQQAGSQDSSSPSTPSKKKTGKAKAKTIKSSKSSKGLNSGVSDTPGLYKKPSPLKDSPVYDLLHTFEKAPDQWAARYILILSSIILRAAIGLGSWSGKGQEPINGDFEAQRHWMEVTINLPIKEWYFYDLEYWGLDYPPLTAYHLWFFGKVGSLIEKEWFQFFTSRGIETSGIKTYMRWTSLISELVIFIPAVLQFISIMGKKLNLRRIDQIVLAAIILNQPSLILIDHGHFQYNSIMLGLFLFLLIDLIKGNFVLASVWFMSSILFKQMALYYAPFIFFFILSKLFIVKPGNRSWFKLIKTLNFTRLILIGVTIFITIITILSPFIILPIIKKEVNQIPKLIGQIIYRMFPFQRGLFEDKVANFWCTTNILIKYNKLFSPDELKKLSLALTLLSILPACLISFYKNVTKVAPSPMLIIFGFSSCAWGFYLFSFQVHEKSVLVPLIPSTLLIMINNEETISIIQWINNISLFSMYPLLKKDDLALQYFVMLLTINWLIGGFSMNLNKNLLWSRNLFWKLIISGSYLSIIAYHLIDYFAEPPSSLPDLFVLLNTTISFGCFSLFYCWLIYKLYKL